MGEKLSPLGGDFSMLELEYYQTVSYTPGIWKSNQAMKSGILSSV
jgi:hypothetical protein